MGTVINLSERRPVTRVNDNVDRNAQSATVVILPVIRIERYDDTPARNAGGRAASVRRRRRRASRS
jgi:hypothetical protein